MKSKASLIKSLNHSLAHMLDLKLQTKQAHWNITGENFIAVHELLDKVAEAVDDYADLIAERIRQLDHAAHGTLQTIAKTSTLPPFPTSTHDSRTLLTAVAKSIKTTSEISRDLVAETEKQDDFATADIYTEITRGLDKWHWMIASNL